MTSDPAGAPTAVSAPETLVPAQSGTITDFFKGKGVTLDPQKAEGFTALNIVLPMPRGWSVASVYWTKLTAMKFETAQIFSDSFKSSIVTPWTFF